MRRLENLENDITLKKQYKPLLITAILNAVFYKSYNFELRSQSTLSSKINIH